MDVLYERLGLLLCDTLRSGKAAAEEEKQKNDGKEGV